MWKRVVIVYTLWLATAATLIVTGRGDNLIADDAYYYFEIARNAAHGYGFTFDSVAATNGFHPLWAWLLVLVYRVFPENYWLPIHIALGLSAFCMAGTGIVMLRLFARRAAPLAGEIASYTWMLNPFSLTLACRGLEQPLNVFLLMISIAVLDRVHERSQFARGELLGLGASTGLAFLARSENVLWFGSMALVLAWNLRGRGGRRWWVERLTWLSAGFLVVSSPWLLWNLITFGSIVQTSVEAKHMFQLYGRLPMIAPSGIHTVGDLWTLIRGAVRNLFLAVQSCFRFATVEEWKGSRSANRLILATLADAALIGVSAFVLRHRPAPENAGLRTLQRRVGASLALFLTLHFVVYVFVVESYSSWYILPPVLVACIGLGLSLGWVSALARPGRRWVALAQAVLLVGVSVATTAGHFLPRPASRDRAYLEIGQTISPRSRIGLWNAGEVGYFFSFHFPDRPVVNLDGLVNNEVTRQARAGRYEEYVLKHVDVVIESPKYFADMMGKRRAEAFVARHIRLRGRVAGKPVSDVIP